VLSDDLEMKAISGRYGHSEATIMAIEAGCDAVLMCAAKPDEQIDALEALIHAVEQERLPIKRVEDAMLRQRRVKERFLAGRPRRPASWQGVLGRDEHLAVAAEMARFA
jgi:beta-N-acetylhexosaminidase